MPLPARLALSLLLTVAFATAGAGSAQAAVGFINGTVTSTADGTAVGGYTVEAINAAGAVVQMSSTTAQGKYSFALDPGNYRVSFTGSDTAFDNRIFAPEFWDDKQTLADATVIPVASGVNTPNVNAALDPAASLAGKVTVDGEGTPLANATVRLRSRTKSVLQTLCTAADGTWKVRRLPPSSYYVDVQHAGTCGDIGPFYDEFYDNTTLENATSIPLAAGQDRAGVDVALTPVSRTLSLTFTGTGTGAVTGSPGVSCTSSCTKSVESGITVTLDAFADSDSTFAGWSGGVCSGLGTCTVTMSSARAVTAQFTKKPGGGGGNTQKLSVALAGTGSGTVTGTADVISCPQTCSADVPTNAVITLTASPAAGSTFTGWGGACTGAGACQVFMSAAQAVTATFAGAPGGGGSGGSGAGGGTGTGTGSGTAGGTGTGTGAGTAATGTGTAGTGVGPGGTPSGTGATGTGTGTGSTPKPAAPRCTLKVRSAKVVRGVVKALVRCDQAATLTLTGAATERAGKGRKAKKRALKAARKSVRAGVSTTVSVRLPAASVRALKARRAQSLALVLTATNANGRASAKASVRALRR